MAKVVSVDELKTIVKLARRAGHKIKGGQNGGGWLHCAQSVGFGGVGKIAAREFLRSKFNPITATPEKIAAVQREVDSRPRAARDEFLSTFEWRRVRMQALKKYGARCQCCGATPASGAMMNVDHIKPRKLFPQLALDIENLQVLCNECNHGKGNWDMTDWRKSNAIA